MLGGLLKSWKARRKVEQGNEAAAERAENEVNPRCVCGCRQNRHLAGICMTVFGSPPSHECRCYQFIARKSGS